MPIDPSKTVCSSYENSTGPIKTPQKVASDQGLHHFLQELPFKI